MCCLLAPLRDIQMMCWGLVPPAGENVSGQHLCYSKGENPAGVVVGISCAVLVAIFLFQRLGTSKIGFSYAPILLLWFTCNAAVGCYNIATCYPAIFRVRQTMSSHSQGQADV